MTICPSLHLITVMFFFYLIGFLSSSGIFSMFADGFQERVCVCVSLFQRAFVHRRIIEEVINNA